MVMRSMLAERGLLTLLLFLVIAPNLTYVNAHPNLSPILYASAVIPTNIRSTPIPTVDHARQISPVSGIKRVLVASPSPIILQRQLKSRSPESISPLNSARQGVYYVQNLQPCTPDSCPTFTPDATAAYVLEVNTRFVATHHIKLGTTFTITDSNPGKTIETNEMNEYLLQYNYDSLAE